MLNEIIFPTSQDILVIGPPRSGTTALCDYIAKQTNFENLDEIWSPIRPTRPALLSNPDKRYVLKLLPEHYFDRDKNKAEIEEKLGNSYVVLLERKNIKEHIISLYVSTITNKWHYQNENFSKRSRSFVKANIPVDLKIMDWCVIRIKDNVKWLKEFDKHADLRLTYEDLGVIDSEYHVFPKPQNHTKLFEALDKNFGSQLT